MRQPQRDDALHIVEESDIEPGRQLAEYGIRAEDVDGAKMGPMPRAETRADILRLSNNPGARYTWDPAFRYWMLRRLLMSCRANDLDIPAWLAGAEEVWDLLTPDEQRDTNLDRERLGLEPRAMEGLHQ